MKPHALLLLMIPSAILFACSRAETPPADSVAAPASAPAPTMMEPASAMASLSGKSGREVTGELRFTAAEGGGVAITGAINGLTKNTEHGFHVHELGDCSAPDAESAGAHLNPAGAPHGQPTATVTSTSPPASHLGDMPNLMSDDTGRATVNATIAAATLRDAGNNDLIGKAVIVHARRDDYTTQPGGDAGDRIACGVIR